MAQSNGKGGKFGELIAAEATARKKWYALQPQGGKPQTAEARTALKALEAAKKALVAATGAANFREAKKAAAYEPQYAVRTVKVKAEVKTKAA